MLSSLLFRIKLTFDSPFVLYTTPCVVKHFVIFNFPIVLSVTTPCVVKRERPPWSARLTSGTLGLFGSRSRGERG